MERQTRHRRQSYMIAAVHLAAVILLSCVDVSYGWLVPTTVLLPVLVAVSTPMEMTTLPSSLTATVPSSVTRSNSIADSLPCPELFVTVPLGIQNVVVQKQQQTNEPSPSSPSYYLQTTANAPWNAKNKNRITTSCRNQQEESSTSTSRPNNRLRVQAIVYLPSSALRPPQQHHHHNNNSNSCHPLYLVMTTS